jgi:hypothetical protein
MEAQSTHSVVFRLKYHPEAAKEALKKLKGLFTDIGGTNVRIFKVNNLDYHFFFNYTNTSVEKYRLDGQKGRDLLASFQGNVVINPGFIHGNCSPDVISCLMQDWHSSYYNEVQVGQPAKLLSSTDPICIVKMRLNVHQDDVKDLLKKWNDLGVSEGIPDLRFYQISAQDYVQLYSFPWKNMEAYNSAATKCTEFLKAHETQITLTDVQAFGDFAPDVMSAAMQHWHPSVVAFEVKV